MTDEQYELHCKKMKFEKEQRDSQEPGLVKTKEDGYAMIVIFVIMFIVYPIMKYYESKG